MLTERNNSRSQIRRFRQDQDLPSDEAYHDPILIKSPDMFYFIHNTAHLSDLLAQRLAELGETRPWMIDRSRIFQYAIVNLARAIDKTPMPGYIKEGGLVELMELTDGLTKLFSQHVHRKKEKVGSGDNSTFLDAYYQDSQGQEKRLHLAIKNQTKYSERYNRLVGVNTQICIKDINGRNIKGRAIAGSDASLRCGLRFRGSSEGFRWSISIDSGLNQVGSERFMEGYDPRDWKIIRPLSQAINQAKQNPDISEMDRTDPSLYTYHYNDLTSAQANQSFSRQMFGEFNAHLAQIFTNLPR